MASKEKFKVLTETEYDALTREERKEYNKELKEYKKEYKKNKKAKLTKYQKRMRVFKIIGGIMAIIFALGILASIFYPLIYMN